MKYIKLELPIFGLICFLLACTSNESNKSKPFANQDPEMRQIDATRDSLKKLGYNYSAEIISKEQIDFDHKQLVYVQDLLDSTNQFQGKVYVELLNDSLFKSLYILKKQDVKYLVNEYMLTNKVDTVKIGSDLSGFKFELRHPHQVVFFGVGKSGMGNSDSWTIEFNTKSQRFDNPYQF